MHDRANRQANPRNAQDTGCHTERFVIDLWNGPALRHRPRKGKRNLRGRKGTDDPAHPRNQDDIDAAGGGGGVDPWPELLTSTSITTSSATSLRMTAGRWSSSTRNDGWTTPAPAPCRSRCH